MSGDTETKSIRRPVVSDMDGTRDGGLVFCLCVIGGMIGTASLMPAALTSFWVWFVLLITAVGIAVNVQRLIARWNGFEETDE